MSEIFAARRIRHAIHISRESCGCVLRAGFRLAAPRARPLVLNPPVFTVPTVVQNPPQNWKWYQQTFMSDIEILYLPWFRDPDGEYQRFFRYMDSTGGFWLWRWGNNPFRTFAMGTFLNDTQVGRVHHQSLVE